MIELPLFHSMESNVQRSFWDSVEDSRISTTTDSHINNSIDTLMFNSISTNTSVYTFRNNPNHLSLFSFPNNCDHQIEGRRKLNDKLNVRQQSNSPMDCHLIVCGVTMAALVGVTVADDDRWMLDFCRCWAVTRVSIVHLISFS